MAHTWSKITKPANTAWTKIAKGGETVIAAGQPMGLLLTLTYANAINIQKTSWTKIVKASGTAWTKITKAN